MQFYLSKKNKQNLPATKKETKQITPKAESVYNSGPILAKKDVGKINFANISLAAKPVGAKCSNEKDQYKLLKMIYSENNKELDSAIDIMQKMSGNELELIKSDLLNQGLLHYTIDNNLELTDKGIEFIESWDNNSKPNSNSKKEDTKLNILKEKIQKWKEEGYNVDELEQMAKSLEKTKK